MSQNPLVSIIVRTQDPKLLRGTLQSIAGQTYRPIEVVLVDDGGADFTRDEIPDILGDISLNEVRLEQNTGRAHAGNVGIGHAKGAYIGFLGSDNVYPEHLSILCAALAIHDCDGVYADFELAGYSAEGESLTFHSKEKTPVPPAAMLPTVLLFEECLPLSAFLLKQSAVRAHWGFQESLAVYADWDLLIRLSAGSPFFHVPVSTVCHLEVIPHHTPQSREAEEELVSLLKKHEDRRTLPALAAYCTYRNQVLRRQSELIGTLREELQKIGSRIDVVSGRLEATEEDRSRLPDELEEMKRQLHEKARYIDEIHASLGWKALAFYREKIKSFIAPSGTKREVLYRLMLRSLSLLRGTGLTYVYRKALNVLRRMRAEKHIRKEVYQVPLIRSETPPVLDTRVSVVIPTRNAGPEFRRTLGKIFSQKGIREIEVIVIDSGSDDDTPAVAEACGAKVYSVPPREFNHGTTRNAGAGKATGEYLVFLSQDAVPVGDSCFQTIVSKMRTDPTIAAVTVRQVPRSDADFFSCWQLWFYNTMVLPYQEDQCIAMGGDELRGLPPDEKRKAAQINNVFSWFRREVFDQYKFMPMPYAEDLDLGLRLIEGQYRILFLASEGVVHSHTRETEYYLERGYIDTKTLSLILGYASIPWHDLGIRSMLEMLTALHALYRKINHGIREFASGKLHASSGVELLSSIKSHIHAGEYAYSGPGDRGIDRFFARIALREESLHPENRPAEQLLINQYCMFLDSFFEYLMQSNIPTGEGKTRAELLRSLYKLFAWTCGSLLGNYAASAESTEEMHNNTYLEAILASRR